MGENGDRILKAPFSHFKVSGGPQPCPTPWNHRNQWIRKDTPEYAWIREDTHVYARIRMDMIPINGRVRQLLRKPINGRVRQLLRKRINGRVRQLLRKLINGRVRQLLRKPGVTA